MEYRSGGTGGPHPGVDIFPDLPPRARPAKEEGYVVIRQLVTVHCSLN